jgi:hypothetical protein
MNKRLFKNLELVGVFFIFGLATLFHYIYELTNGSVFSILFGAVNESVWENTKIFLIAYLIWALIEVLTSNVHFKQFVVSKVIGLYFMGAFIIILFYIYTFFTGKIITAVDITIGALAVIFAQLISYKLTTGDKDLKQYFIPSLFLLGLFLIGYFSFSVFPPHLELFRDSQTGFYGIVPDYIDKGAAVLNSTL